MSRTRTLTSLILDCRQRANMENSTFCTDAEITEYLNQEIAELWARLVQGEGHPHYRASQAYTVTASTNVQGIPGTFWRVQEVTALIGGWNGALTPFMAQERARLINVGTLNNSTCAPQYRIQAGNIEFLPTTQDFTATLFFTPCQPRLVAGSDVFDGFNGYEMACIHGTVATMRAKQDEDASFYLGQKERILNLIDSLAGQRDASAPERVQDVVGLGGWFP